MKNKEESIIKIIVILNNLKKEINPSYDNKHYQIWNKDRHYVPFRSYVIEKAKDNILKVLDSCK